MLERVLTFAAHAKTAGLQLNFGTCGPRHFPCCALVYLDAPGSVADRFRASWLRATGGGIEIGHEKIQRQPLTSSMGGGAEPRCRFRKQAAQNVIKYY